MRNQLKGFVVGVVFACLLFVPTIALADSIQAYFNTASITIDGKEAVKQGEDYKLSNGSAVPFSINYKGTTYIPVRKISELLGVGISYNNKTKTIQITKNANAPISQEEPAEVKTTNAAVTYSTSYAVFNECTKNRNDDNKKVAHVLGFKDGKKIETNIDYSYYKTISSKLNTIQLWKATVDSKNNITKVKTVSISKSGKIKNNNSRDYVSLSSGKYNLDNNVDIYKWTDDDEYKLYSGNLKKNDIVNLYDTDGNRDYDVVIFTRDYKGDVVTEKDTTTNTEKEKEDNKNSDTQKSSDTSKSKEKPKVSSKGFAVICECTRAANDEGDKVQNIVGFKDGSRMDIYTTGQYVVKGWSEPKAHNDGFSNAYLYKIGVSANDIVVSADKVSADIGQTKVDKANGRDSVVTGNKTYTLSGDVIFYQITDDDEYKIHMGSLKQNDIVQLYETDGSNSGYDIVIFSRP